MGTVASVGTNSFTITFPNGSTTINVSASTTFEVMTSATSTPTTGSLNNIVVGVMVAVKGEPQQGGVNARTVRIFPAGTVLPPMPPMSMGSMMGKMMDGMKDMLGRPDGERGGNGGSDH